MSERFNLPKTDNLTKAKSFARGKYSGMSSRTVAADIRRRILARKTPPPRYLGGNGACDDS